MPNGDKNFRDLLVLDFALGILRLYKFYYSTLQMHGLTISEYNLKTFIQPLAFPTTSSTLYDDSLPLSLPLSPHRLSFGIPRQIICNKTIILFHHLNKFGAEADL